MNASKEMLKIAADVLVEAKRVDRRLEVDKNTVAAWARCFEGSPVFPTEALDAVYRHYKQQPAFPLMPGDVVAYCEAQPPWSSAEHASAFLDLWVNHPYSSVIEDYAGIRMPHLEIPDSLSRELERQWLVDQISRWVNENRADLVAAILERRHKPVGE